MRLEKLAAGDADALLLAVSGLERIGRTDVISQVLSPEEMMPPIGAGILALQCREDDTAVIDAVSGLGDPDTHREATAERMFLHVLQGHCNSPIAGYARVDRSGELSLRACVFTPDGKTRLNAHEWAVGSTRPRWAPRSRSRCCGRARGRSSTAFRTDRTGSARSGRVGTGRTAAPSRARRVSGDRSGGAGLRLVPQVLEEGADLVGEPALAAWRRRSPRWSPARRCPRSTAAWSAHSSSTRSCTCTSTWLRAASGAAA